MILDALRKFVHGHVHVAVTKIQAKLSGDINVRFSKVTQQFMSCSSAKFISP